MALESILDDTVLDDRKFVRWGARLYTYNKVNGTRYENAVPMKKC